MIENGSFGFVNVVLAGLSEQNGYTEITTDEDGDEHMENDEFRNVLIVDLKYFLNNTESLKETVKEYLKDNNY